MIKEGCSHYSAPSAGFVRLKFIQLRDDERKTKTESLREIKSWIPQKIKKTERLSCQAQRISTEWESVGMVNIYGTADKLINRLF